MKIFIHIFPLIIIINYFVTGCSDMNSLERVPSEYADLPGMLIDRDTVWTGELRLTGQYYVLPGYPDHHARNYCTLGIPQ